MFFTIIVQPLLNILFFLYAVIPGHDYGVAVILLTVLVRLVLWPLASKQLHSQKKMTAIQPEVNRLKNKHKKDSQKFNAAVMELYKEKEVNPFSSCLPTVLQFPFLIGLFYVFLKFKNPDFLKLTPEGILKDIYPFIQNFGPVKVFISAHSAVSTTLLGFMDLAKPSIALALVAGALQFVQSKMLMPKEKGADSQSALTSQMTYLFPVLTVFIAWKLPAALPLYWSVTTLFAVGQQYLIMHRDIEVLEEGKKK